MKRFLWLIPVVGVLTALGLGVFGESSTATVNTQAPAFELESLNGKAKYGTKQVHGKHAVINFWASWCVPCKTEAPELNREARARPNVAFMGVNFKDGRTEARSFVSRYEISYPNVFDPNGIVSKKYKLTGAPETFFLDETGRIVGVFKGELLKSELTTLLNQLEGLAPGDVLDR